MYLQRLLQINMATLAAMGTLLVGMGQRSAGLPLMMSVAAITSVWLTDVTGRFRLSRKVANVAALAALVLTARELLQFNSITQILGLVRLLIYVQIILLFQEKDLRTYRHLIILSLLQVIVAAIFMQGLWFGGLLIVYMLVGLSALTLLCLHREHELLRPAVEPPSPESHFTGGACSHGPMGVGRELFGRLAVTGAATLGLTLLLFCTVPRLGRTAWRGPNILTKHLVGFSDKVTLGELGQIIESPDEVMRIWLVDASTGRPYAAPSEIYLRGAILTQYQDGQWEPQKRPSDGPPVAFRPNEHAEVLQRIAIEPLDRRELFCVWPPIAIEPNDDLQLRGDRLVRVPNRRNERFEFQLGTTAFDNGVQTRLVPCKEAKPNLRTLLQTPELPRLTALAERWAIQSRIGDRDQMAMARYLEHQFRRPGLFQYSLKGPIRDESIDPIEDFVVNNRSGHCEYFATALALMLRSRGIPSRVVVGYKCDEFNNFDDFYNVRQWHAHSWVEAYLGPEYLPEQLAGQLPEQLPAADEADQWKSGGWLRLEPTPGAATGRADDASLTGQVNTAFHWLQSLWANYVMEMDRDRQYEAIYQPILDAIRRVIDALRDPDWWRGLLQRGLKTLDPTRWAIGQWVLGTLTLLVALPVSILLIRRICRVAWRLGHRLVGRAIVSGNTDRAEVAFYRRLEALLARRGLRRSTAQTQHEFAAHAGARIAQMADQPDLALLPLTVVEAFYHVRFGRLPLDNATAQAVEQALDELEKHTV